MNITKSTSIETHTDVRIDNVTFPMTGSYGTVFKTFVLQSRGVIAEHIYGKNFTNVEVNALLEEPTFIKGVVAFYLSSGKQECPVELRRIAGNCAVIIDLLVSISLK